jgi:hypothetical protein
MSWRLQLVRDLGFAEKFDLWTRDEHEVLPPFPVPITAELGMTAGQPDCWTPTNG